MGKEARQKVEEASMEKERVLLKEKQMTSHNTRLSEELRSIKTDLNSRHNQMMDGLKTKHKSILAGKDSELSSVEDRVAKLETQCERLERENKG